VLGLDRVNPAPALAGELLFRATRWLVSPTRCQFYGHDAVIEHKQQGRSLIFVCWHAHDFVNLGIYKRAFGPAAPGVIMVRDNHNGRVLQHFSRRMRLGAVSLGAGPGSRQWASGVVKMVHLIQRGHDGMLAVDGPEGPAYQVKPGAAVMALRAAALIVPTASAARPAVRLRYRWDEQLVPLPGARIGFDSIDATG
jgi:lysophospholipid acyltransferase (LPLAT)-like uncharacterized protein